MNIWDFQACPPLYTIHTRPSQAATQPGVAHDLSRREASPYDIHHRSGVVPRHEVRMSRSVQLQQCLHRYFMRGANPNTADVALCVHYYPHNFSKFQRRIHVLVLPGMIFQYHTKFLQTPWHARSKYAKVSFAKLFDLTAAVTYNFPLKPGQMLHVAVCRREIPSTHH